MVTHLNCFFPSWTVSTCLLKMTFITKLALQISHVNYFFPSWAFTIWLFKLPACNMYVKISLKSKLWIAHVTIICIVFSFMNYFNMKQNGESRKFNDFIHCSNQEHLQWYLWIKVQVKYTCCNNPFQFMKVKKIKWLIESIEW